MVKLGRRSYLNYRLGRTAVLAALPRSQEGGGVWGMTSGVVVLVRELGGAWLGVTTTTQMGGHTGPMGATLPPGQPVPAL